MPAFIEQPAANAAINCTQEQMLQILQEMRAAQSNADNAGQGNHNGGGRALVNRRTPDNASFNCRDTLEYCHIHGACNHTSWDCNKKAPGHRNTSTRANIIGGSNAFYQPSTIEV